MSIAGPIRSTVSDKVVDEGEAFAAQLADASVPVTFRRGDGLTHGFFRAFPFSEAARTKLLAFAAFVGTHLGARRGLTFGDSA